MASISFLSSTSPTCCPATRSEDAVIDYEDETKLWEALSRLPPTTTRKDGTCRGGALNLIIIGDIKKPFIKASRYERVPKKLCTSPNDRSKKNGQL
jgi:hypothetical protein